MKLTGKERAEEVNVLEEIQRQTELSADSINFFPRATRHNAEQIVLEDVKKQPRGAAMSERPVERKVLRRQARQARARRAVKCNLMP